MNKEKLKIPYEIYQLKVIVICVYLFVQIYIYKHLKLFHVEKI